MPHGSVFGLYTYRIRHWFEMTPWKAGFLEKQIATQGSLLPA